MNLGDNQFLSLTTLWSSLNQPILVEWTRYVYVVWFHYLGGEQSHKIWIIFPSIIPIGVSYFQWDR